MFWILFNIVSASVNFYVSDKFDFNYFVGSLNMVCAILLASGEGT